MHPVDLALLLGYLGFMLGLGIWVGRRVRSFREYFIVSGRLTTPLLICTLVSTYYGLDVLFGVSEVSYQEGLVGFYVYSRPYYLFILVAALLIARRLKRFDFLSLPDVAGRFYGNPARVLCAVASFFYSLPIIAVMGLAVMLEVLFGIPFAWGVVAAAAFSLAYTVLGGLIADSVTDTVQFVLMCVTLGAAAWIGLDRVGGMEGLAAAVPERYFSATGGYPAPILLVFALAATSAMVDPGFYQRIFAATSWRAVALALVLGVLLWAAFDWVTTVLGMIAFASDLEVAAPRYALLQLTVELLPTGLLGLFVVGAVATAMSTIDSYLLISGGNVAYDIWRPLRRRPTSDEALVRATRLAMVGSATGTVLLALFFRSIVSAWLFMATMLVSTALVPILAGLYLRPPHSRAAGTAAAAVGLLSALLFYLAVHWTGAWDPEWETVVAEWTFAGSAFPAWQEHALLVALPASVTAYALGAFYERRIGPRRRRAAGNGPPASDPGVRP